MNETEPFGRPLYGSIYSTKTYWSSPMCQALCLTMETQQWTWHVPCMEGSHCLVPKYSEGRNYKSSRSGHRVPEQFQRKAPAQPGGSSQAKRFQGEWRTCGRARNARLVKEGMILLVIWRHLSDKGKEWEMGLVWDGRELVLDMFWFSVHCCLCYFVLGCLSFNQDKRHLSWGGTCQLERMTARKEERTEGRREGGIEVEIPRKG